MTYLEKVQDDCGYIPASCCRCGYGFDQWLKDEIMGWAIVRGLCANCLGDLDKLDKDAKQ